MFNKTIKPVILLTILLIIPLSFSKVKDRPLKRKGILGTLALEPKEGDLILSNPKDAGTDYYGNIYLLDAANQRIIKFDREFNLIWKIGSKGEGPGEFTFNPYMFNPGYLTVSDSGRIYVFCTKGKRIQIFDRDGKYLSEFRVPWIIDRMDLDSKGNLYLSTKTRTSKELIYVFSPEGKYLYSFDNRLIEIPENYYFNDTYFSIDRKNDEIYTIFRPWPILRKYRKDGTLIWEKRLDLKKISKRMKKIVSKWPVYDLKFLQNNKRPENDLIYAQFINIDYYNNRLYLFHWWNAVLELDKEGNVLNCYYNPDFDEFKNFWNIRIINGDIFYFTEEEDVVWIYSIK